MGKKMRTSVWDRHGVVERMIGNTELPRMVPVRQKLNDERVEDIPRAVKEALSENKIGERIRPGMKIAITAGSRGVANIPVILRELVRNLRELGAEPFIINAMGSHGGGTAEGQREILEGLGITEEAVEAPVRVSMDVVQIGNVPDGRPVYIDKAAAESDGIVVAGRVKPHTAYRGAYESGLCKMLAIGLGKHKGAEACHSQGFAKMAENVPLYADAILSNANILFGLAVIENAHDETNRFVALGSEEILEKEPDLLVEAREKMARIYFENIDVMILDEIGKNHSGDGMDPNVTGSYSTPYASGPPYVDQYVVLSLSEETHGNSLGVGMAQFTTKRVFDETDFDAAYPNALTARVVLGVRMPMVLNNDRLAIQAAVYVSRGNGATDPRVVRIPNSSHVGTIRISESLLDEAKASPNIELLGEPEEMAFDNEGNLTR